MALKKDQVTETEALKVGQKAPAFSALDEAGNKVSLKDFKGQKVVLYFYPKDNTSGCTKEACDFRDTIEKFKKAGAAVIGVSPDSAKSHVNFKEKFALPFPLLVDEDKKILSDYGAWREKAMYGRKFMGVERTTIVIDEEGTVSHIFPKVKVNDHVMSVLKALLT